MTTNKLFLLLGTSLSLIPQSIYAAECAVTDCSLLGYTDSACPGSGLKCPFGDGWYCGGGAAEDCIKLGYDKNCTGAGESGNGETCNGKYQSCACSSSYKYTCTGTGYSGGSGSACGGKYTKCNCKSPYTWTSGACKCPSTYKYTCSGTGYSGGSGTACAGKYTKCNCSNNYAWNGSNCVLSCSADYQYSCSGTGYSGGSGSVCGGKYTKCNCASGYEWKNGVCLLLNGAYDELYYCNGKVVGVKASGMNFYVAMKDLGRMKWSDAHTQYYNYIFCGNARGEFPTLSQLQTIYNNKSRVNTLLSTNGGTQLVNAYYWASNRGSYDGNEIFFAMSMEDGNVANYDYYDGHYVRIILTSW